ncbi:spore coat protein U domain-containing protein [Ramlibacter sp. CrO1]|uniref:Spore coat protein U domain-containing protein n=1 Tax=Ramlibacter algicola TaxID=2795217 RepID=A0A934PZ03_9BURK|nr:spore coat protein U domain-containing protein [Ramlibacter algicola]
MGLNFGVYDPFATVARDTQASVGLTCSRVGGPQNNTITLALSAGAHGTSTADRRLAGSGVPTTISYNLYRDSGRTFIWGNTPGVDAATELISVPNNGSASTTVVIYGRIPANQDVYVGSYADQVTLTVTP